MNKMKRNSGLQQKTLALVILLTGVLLSIFLFQYLKNEESESAWIEFEQDSKTIFTAIKSEIDIDLKVVKALQAFYVASDLVGREDFEQFTEQFLLESPSIEALEWAPRVFDDHRVQFENRAHMEGLTGFEITESAGPELMGPAAKRKVYWSQSLVKTMHF